jgi:hypothetical protein
VRLPRLERLVVCWDGFAAVDFFLEGFAALCPSVPAFRVMAMRTAKMLAAPQTVELLAELRAAWPGLELQR